MEFVQYLQHFPQALLKDGILRSFQISAAQAFYDLEDMQTPSDWCWK
jgi:hypothetical protein